MLLQLASRILTDKRLCKEYAETAHKMYMTFIQQLPHLYGHEYISYSVHSLKHFKEDVLAHGAIDENASWEYESKLGCLKKDLRKASRPIQQLAKRHDERKKWCKSSSKKSYPQFSVKRKRFNGAEKCRYTNINCFGTVQLEKFCLTDKIGNNHIGRNGQIYKISHIARAKEINFVVFISVNTFCTNAFIFPSISRLGQLVTHGQIRHMVGLKLCSTFLRRIDFLNHFCDDSTYLQKSISTHI